MRLHHIFVDCLRPARHSGPMSTSSNTLPRVMGLWTAIALVVGGTIGTGVFAKPAVVARELGSFPWAISAWVLCGILAFFGTMALAELSSLFPQAGGNYVYLKRGYGPLAAFLWGWIEFWVMRTGSIAALAWLATEAILVGFLRQSADPFILLMGSLLIVLVLTGINAIGLSYGSILQNVTTWLKIGTLLVIIVLPVVLGAAEPRLLGEEMSQVPDRVTGFAAAMLAILWAYKGWADLGAVAEDIREPERNLPRAFGLGIAIIAGLYVGANIAYALVLSPGEMAKVPVGQTVAASFVQKMLLPWGTTASDWGGRLVSLAIAISALGAMNASVLVGPRGYFALARDGLFPRWMSSTAGAQTTPLTSMLLQCLWTCLLIIGAELARRFIVSFTENPFDTLTVYVVLGAVIFETLAISAVFRLRKLEPTLPRPFRCWGYPWAPALHIVAMGYVLVKTVQTQWLQSSAAIGFILLGAVVYFVFHGRRR
jgi:APA family basic amino acid/polyamine antiporter